jgi:hypothetical protein
MMNETTRFRSVKILEIDVRHTKNNPSNYLVASGKTGFRLYRERAGSSYNDCENNQTNLTPLISKNIQTYRYWQTYLSSDEHSG